MAEQAEKAPIGKLVGVGVAALVAVFIYYYFIDWLMMNVVQNLPFPYRPTK